ncbi:MAG: DUF4421 domain-containing protein [Tannerellaceae bacterium]|nr:DUF4421 domain-containing protein [Tannerellaceae bacterium]
MDSAYIRPFPEEFTIRPYFYYKFTTLTTQINGEEEMRYHPNTPVGIGVGFTYRNYALNLAYAPPFFRDKEKGKTKYIDLQYHYYSRKYLFDLLFQDYKGFYNVYNRRRELVHLYPDIHVIQYGASGQYVFNHRKFSYRAAFYGNEKQVRPAGSFQVGGGLYYNKLNSDTTQILAGRNWFRNYQLSVTGGYVYTFVFKRDFFVTAGLSAGVNLGIEKIGRSGERLEVTPNLFPRVAWGYNGDDWALLFNFVLNSVTVTRSGGMFTTLETGRVNMSYVHRIGSAPVFLKKIKLLNRNQPY